MGPHAPLPISPEWSSVDEYVDSLLSFTTSSWLLQTLCGGVHILDFYTRSPDLYSTILPESWRTWFKAHEIMDILDFLMREDMTQFDESNGNASWRGGPAPPEDLLQYVKDVRRHSLVRDFPPPNSGLEVPKKSTIARSVAVGMKVKKIHEVDNFARYVDRLTADIATSGRKEITHIADFGSGQNYLGRALAAPPYSKHVIAVESKPHNIQGAKNMDVLAKLVAKPVTMVNKKEYRKTLKKKKGQKNKEDPLETPTTNSSTEEVQPVLEPSCGPDGCGPNGCAPEPAPRSAVPDSDAHPLPESQKQSQEKTVTTTLQIYNEGHGSVQYVEHIIKDGDLSPVVDQILDSFKIQENNVTHKNNVVEEACDVSAVPKSPSPNLMVISLHSCGNLVHHGLRSLLINPAVSAVAMVGCCYNLMTERLGPPTYKLPTLRPNHPRLESTANAFDPHGFPMSEKLATYPLPHEPITSASHGRDVEPPHGVRLNITARMMAVQAPYNWGAADSELFFTRHFYRALLQRIFLDHGIVAAPVDATPAVSAAGHSSRVAWTPPNGRGPGLSSDGTTTPLTIGTLRKFAYKDFLSYVRAALSKLTTPNSFCEVDPEFIKGKTEALTDEDILNYEREWGERKKELSIMWSLMAFSASVVEAVVVTDRWLWLKEQEEVDQAWVEAVFGYDLSPRNLVVVGIKK